MLNVNDLKTQIKIGLSGIITPAIERVVLMMLPEKSDMGDELAKEISEAFDELTSDSLSELIANAIDYHVKNISISGTIITVGSPVTQTAQIIPAPNPISAGKIPNTLGIS